MKTKLITTLLFFIMLLYCCFPVFADAVYDVHFILNDIVGEAGENINIAIHIESKVKINSVALYNLEYDANILTFVGFDNYGSIESKCMFPGGFDNQSKVITLALKESEELSEYICNLQFMINSGVSDGVTSVKLTSLVKDNSNVITSNTASCSVTVTNKRVGHTHELVKIDAVAATCHSTGNIEYWTCVLCNNNYSDNLGNNSLSAVTTPIDNNNHDGLTTHHNIVEATETQNGYSGDIYCLGCGIMLNKGNIIPALKIHPETADAPNNTDAVNNINTNPFDDIYLTDEYYQAVQYVYEQGLFKGVSESEFAPNLTMTRAMFVTVLGRLSNIDTAKYTTSNFDDVKTGEWYSPYVEWAARNGIVKGYGGNTFGLDDEITIEQAAAIIYRYAGFIGENVKANGELTGYSDSKDVSEWAVSALKWAVGNDIYTGKDGKLNPQDEASRALVATMFYNYVTEYEK